MSITRANPSIDRDGDLPLTARNAELSDLVTILREQHARKVDVVAPATAIRADEGMWQVEGADQQITLDGVTTADGTFRPTGLADSQMAQRLGIPVDYLRRLRGERVDLYDANVNGWLHGSGLPTPDDGEAGMPEWAQPDSRSFLVRTFRGDDNGRGVARALLSDRFRIVDHLDVLVAALDGIREAGIEAHVSTADLTERRMYVKVDAPEINALAPDLIGNYRSPFSGNTGTDNPTVFAGLVIGNSETGGGAFTITPRITFDVCSNGMTITKDAARNVHLGGKMDEGVVRWSDEAQERNLELVKVQTRDAVRTFLDVDYMRGVLDGMRAKAGKPVDDAQQVVKDVTSALKMASIADDVLNHFIAGGSLTAGGVMNALTSYAQTVDDADKAAEIEDAALDALALAAR